MAMDGILMLQINKELQGLLPCKLTKIQQISQTEILLTLRAKNQNQKLMISAHSSYNRIHLTARDYVTMDTPSVFVMALRKHIQGAIIRRIEQAGLDRILKMTLEARNELGDMHDYALYVELMGKYANVILVDDENKVVDALKRIPPFENNIRTIHPGADFVCVKAQAGKQDPFHAENLDMEESFTTQCSGFSPLLSNEVHYRIKQGETFAQIMEIIAQSKTLYVTVKDDKEYFHVLPLLHIDDVYKAYPLQEGMDIVYYQKEEKIRIKDASGDLFKVVRKELKKNRNKQLKLEKTLEDAYDLDKYRIYGDLLYAYSDQYPFKQKSVTLLNWDNKEITIPLDEKWDMKTNAKKYYQKYTKSKNAQIEVAKQIEITKDAIQYFELLEMQLESASINDAKEIREELENKGYLKKKSKGISRKKKKKPNFMTLQVDDTFIYIGKNNIQNDYVTWKQAKKEHTWLHVKDTHGSHVVIDAANPNETVLRMAAMFAAYYSKARQSSSVPVNYCPIKNLRKPNNASLGFVTLTSYKTIYIDPDENAIYEYLRLYQIKS